MSDNNVIGIKIVGDATSLKAALTDASSSVQAHSQKVENFADVFNAAHARMDKAQQNTALSAKQLNFAMANLPAQFTDIVTSLQGGQRPLTVLLQQGGQIKDMFGGIVPAFRAVGGYVLGLLNPFTLLAGGVAAVGAAYYMGSKETDAFNKAIITSGNAAGVTTSDLRSMAQQISQTTGTQAAAAEALAAMVSTGSVARENVAKFSETALLADKYLGQSVKDTVQAFTELGRSPTEASAKLNQQLHYLTGSLYEQIKALEDRGQKEAAAELAQGAYSTAQAARIELMKSQLGALESAWMKVAEKAKGAWDYMLGVGRETTLDDKIKEIESRLNPQPGGLRLNPALQSEYRDQLEQLKAQKAEQIIISGLEAQRAKQADATVRLAGRENEFLSNRQKLEKELAAARKEASDAGWDDKRTATLEKNIRRKYRDNDAIALQKAMVERDVDGVKKALDELVSGYTNADRVLEGVHANGYMVDKAYFDAKRTLIEAETKAKQDAADKELAILSRQKFEKPEDRVANERKMADIRAQTVKDQNTAQTSLVLLTQQETEALNKRNTALLTAKQIADQYVADLRRSGGRELLEMQMSNLEKDYSSRQYKVSEDARQKRLALDQNRERLMSQTDGNGRSKWTDQLQEDYIKQLAIINQQESQATRIVRDNWAQRLMVMGDWQNGAEVALKNYADSTRDTFSRVADLVTNAFKGMEDALVKFVTTGKLDFRSLADSIISDLIRIQVQKTITGPLASSNFMGQLSGSLGSLFGAPSLTRDDLQGFASGGQPPVGKISLVGEKGPELFVPSTPGTIIPNHMLQSVGGSSTVYSPVLTVNIDSRTDQAAIYSGVRQMLVQHTEQQYEDMRRLGVLA